MKRPNFFIIGAPKCGTTSFAAWLAEHPKIYMSPLKEPHHFNDEEPDGIRNLREYESLFEGAGEQHVAVGEASVRYLYSGCAVSNILRYAPDARFIVMIRNPVEMAPSLHEQRLFSLNEDVQDFETAWKLQAERALGHFLPQGCLVPARLQYGAYCRLGEQLDRLLQKVPRERCKFILLDDIRRDPRAVYLDVLQFLGVPDDGRKSFPKMNVAKDRRSRAMARFITGLGRLKKRMGFSPVKGWGLLNRINRWNRAERPRPSISPTMKQVLIAYYRDDIRKMETILGRDLGKWLSLEEDEKA